MATDSRPSRETDSAVMTSSRVRSRERRATATTADTSPKATRSQAPSTWPSLGVVASYARPGEGQTGHVPRSTERPPAPILFAHRGGRAHSPENSLQAFETAIRLGATGLESDVWCTADGIPVLHHDRRVGSAWRRRPIDSLARDRIPDDVPTLEDLYRLVGGGVPLSLDIRDPAVTPAVLEVARRHEGTRSLWLCHPDRSVLADIRETDRDVILVHSTRIERIDEGPERMAADLSGMAIHAVNLPEQDWSAGLVALFRRFGLRCLAWDAQHPRQIDRLLALGLDGIYGDHVDRLVDGLARRRATN
mgnify:CR=1 FL=1